MNNINFEKQIDDIKSWILNNKNEETSTNLYKKINALHSTVHCVEKLKKRKTQNAKNINKKQRIDNDIQDLEILEKIDVDINKNRNPFCYVCKTLKKNLNEGIKQMSGADEALFHFKCHDCIKFNTLKRNICADLRGKTSIVTGARVKIGFEIAIKLLSSGSVVIATTRFPMDALNRFSNHVDFESFRDRLIVYPLDLRYKNDMDDFISYIYKTYEKIDILINNACQTIQRPKNFYEHLISNEKTIAKLIENCESVSKDNIHENNIIIPYNNTIKNVNTYIDKIMNPLGEGDCKLFPHGKYDENSEQIDLRTTNTWVQEIGDIDIRECANLFSINTLAPFHLIQSFIPIMTNKNIKSDNNGSYIINVSSMEGVFNTRKTTKHPQTNMAKSAMNMITRSCSRTLAKKQIYMSSVDTGWVTNEHPYGYKSKVHLHNDKPLLDNIDGACRVLDPVFKYYNTGVFTNGMFLKDYVVSKW